MRSVPRLRFKEFNDEWEEKRFEELVKKEKKITYGVVKPGEFCDDGIFLIKASDYSKGWNLENLFKISRELDFSYKRSKVGEGDILFTIVGSVGNTAIVPKYLENSNITQQTARLSIDSNFFSNIFIYNFLSTIQNRKQTLNYLKEGVQPSINLSDLEKFKILIPNLQEQQKIADFLSSVDKKIYITEEKLNLFNEYKKGIMQKIFNQELRFKDENGNDYPEWNLVTTKEISKITMGFTPSTKDESMWNGEYKWLSIADLKENGKYIHKTSKTITEKGTKNKKILKKGTLIMSFKLTLGRLGIISEEMFTNEAICHFNWNNENSIDTEYVYYYLNSIDISSFGKQAVKGITLNTESLNSIEIDLPCIEEQQKIADFLSAIDTKIEKISDELENLKEFKKGLLQQMFV